MVLPDLLGVDRGEADAVVDGLRVPRLADTEAIHLSYFHVRNHLRRWDGDEGDVGTATCGVTGIDATGGEPVADPHGMGAGWECHGEGHWMAGSFGGVDKRLERFRVGPDFSLERVGK